jgi:hypothetical protein
MTGKTTRGKGRHVVTQLAVVKGKNLDWYAAKEFAHDVCQEMARENPDRYLIKMAKAKCRSRIILPITYAMIACRPRWRHRHRVLGPVRRSPCRSTGTR